MQEVAIMCERRLTIMKLSEVRNRLGGSCSINCKKGTISLTAREITEERVQYLEEFAQLDQTTHSERNYKRWIVNFGILIVNDEIKNN